MILENAPAKSATALENISLLALVRHRISVPAGESIERVYEHFQRHNQEYVGVTSQGQLLGLVSRGQMGFLLASRFGFSVYARQAIENHMMKRYLQVPVSLPLLKVIEAALSREGEEFYDDVALVDNDNHYLGVISVETLIRLQSKLFTYKSTLAENQQRALEDKNQQLSESLNQLRQSQGRYQSLFDNSALGVALLNRSGEIQTCNHRMAVLLAGSGATPAVTNLATVVSPVEQNTFLALLQNHEENNERQPHASEFTVLIPGRGQRLFKFFTHWIRETDQITVLLDDITEQRMYERAMAQKEKSAMLESLVGGIAHEINNKLSPIIGFAELLTIQLERNEPPNKLQNYGKTIRDSAVESAKIIRQLLQLSRPTTSELGLCDLRTIVQDALTILSFRLRESGCHLELGLPATEAPIIADPAQIKQIIINLILNALDAMEDRSTRRLRLAVTGQLNHVILEVEDTGHGIKPEHLSRIFDPFFTTKGPDRGTGLGLSVCFSIIKQHGGEIQAESTENIGTLFKIILPSTTPLNAVHQAARPVNETTANDKPAVTISSPHARILIVDDDEFVTQMLQEALKLKLSGHIELRHSGEQAVSLLEKADFDLIISDVRMPGMGGFGLFQWIKLCRPQLANHFLFITGDAGGVDLNEQLEALGIPVLRKPFAVDDLIRECLRMARKQSIHTAA